MIKYLKYVTAIAVSCCNSRSSRINTALKHGLSKGLLLNKYDSELDILLLYKYEMYFC